MSDDLELVLYAALVDKLLNKLDELDALGPLVADQKAFSVYYEVSQQTWAILRPVPPADHIVQGDGK